MAPEKTDKAGVKTAADRIRASARELFYAQGIRAVGVEEIVANAGVTKPSLYRAYESKDELAAAYLRQYGADFVATFDSVVAPHLGNPRAQFRAWFERLERRAAEPRFRGCGITNAAVEYPEPDHPARIAACANKQGVRARFREMTREMGARDPEALADALFLLMEGVYATSQLFEKPGPAKGVSAAADALIAAHLPPQRTRRA